MQAREPTEGIGSFFAAPALDDPAAKLPAPWAVGGDPIYLQSGRQALRLIGEVLWQRGYRRLVLPGHLCESMITPFRGREWSIVFTPLDERVRPDAGRYAEACAERPDRTAVVVAEYFGRNLGQDMQEAMSHWQGQGAAVIEDRSHNLLSPRRSAATYAFGSLRKLLPVADGCFLHGLDVLGDDVSPRMPDPSVPGWEAMDLKAAGDPSGGDGSRRLYQRAEAEFDVAMDAAPMSRRSLSTLPYLDFEAMGEARKANFGLLRELVEDLVVINDDCGDGTPAFLVLRVADAKVAQDQLAKAGVFCPIHWRRPHQVPQSIPWRDDLLSVPVDHRYGSEDMRRVAESLVEVVRRHG